MRNAIVVCAVACALLCGAGAHAGGLPSLPQVKWTPLPTIKITPIPPIKITVPPLPDVHMPCPVIISEVMVNPTDRGDAVGEYVELLNTSMFDVDISDWIVRDNVGSGRIVDFTRASDLGVSGTTIPPFGYALIVDRDYDGMYNDAIRSDDEADLDALIMVRMQNADGSGEIGNGLANDGDAIRITTDYEDENGNSVVLHCTWGLQNQEGKSYQLCGNGWFTRDATPGAPNWCGI